MRRSHFLLIASLGLLQVGGLVVLSPYAAQALEDDGVLFLDEDAAGFYEEGCPALLDEVDALDVAIAEDEVFAVEEPPVVDELNADVTAPVEPRVEAAAPRRLR